MIRQPDELLVGFEELIENNEQLITSGLKRLPNSIDLLRPDNELRQAIYNLSSIAGDTLLTCLLLPTITCIAVTLSVRNLVDSGKMTSISKIPNFLQILNRPLMSKSLILGAIGLISGTLVILAMIFFQIQSAPFDRFVIAKGIYTGVLGVIVTSITAILAMAQSQEKHLELNRS